MCEVALLRTARDWKREIRWLLSCYSDEIVRVEVCAWKRPCAIMSGSIGTARWPWARINDHTDEDEDDDTDDDDDDAAGVAVMASACTEAEAETPSSSLSVTQTTKRII
jgi:hypothetical protein